jgi:uncharacterized membrane protein YsdA (DUF1294 family)
MLKLALILCAVMSLVTCLAFGIDKWKAGRRARRIPEATLLLFAFLLGFPGAWAGAQVFRHKTRKSGFLARLVLVSVVNPLWLFLWLGLRG